MVEAAHRWLLPLLITSPYATAKDEPFPLDRVRLQKAVFLLARGSSEWSDCYSYRPYNWGPYSAELTHDTDDLIARGLIRIIPPKNSRYGSYASTPTGEEVAASAWAKLNNAEQNFLQEVRQYVTNRSFARLLREVYAAFPEYATESLFRA